MAFRFRKSYKIAPGIRVNVSKRGLGVSAGTKGARVGVGPKGKYVSGGIPGTGIYGISYLSEKGKPKASANGKIDQKATFQIAIPPSLNSVKDWVAKLFASILVFPLFSIIIYLFSPVLAIILLGIVLILWLIQIPHIGTYNIIKNANLALQQENIELAIDLLKRIDKSEEDYHIFNRDLGILYQVNSDHDNALKYYQEYLTKYEDPKVKALAAISLNELEKYNEALGILRNLPSEEKQNLVVINATGNAHLKMGNPELALAVLERGPIKSRKVDSQMMTLRYLLGLTYKELGKKRQALTQFNKVYAEYPDFEDVENKIKELGGIK